MIVIEALMNRFRGTGVIKHFGTLNIGNTKVSISFNGNHLYGLWIALVLGVATMNAWLGLAVLVAYLVGESKGWGEWLGNLTRTSALTEEVLQKNYAEDEGATFPYVHQTANFFIKEKIEGTLEERSAQYLKYARLALTLRGFYWWLPVYVTLALFDVITFAEAFTIATLLGIAFPIAAEIGKRVTFTKTYDLKFIKLSFSQGWENQEIVYGAVQGALMWYVVLGVVYG